MSDIIYSIYRQLDSSIVFSLVIFNMYYLCTPKKRFTAAVVTLVSAVLYFVLYISLNALAAAVLHGENVYWVFIVSILLAAAIIYAIFFRSSAFMYFTYILFFVTFIQLYSIILSPLYERESAMQVQTYRIADMATRFLFYVLLILLSLLFRRVHISEKIAVLPRKLALILYFPLSVLVAVLFMANIDFLWDYSAPILAAIILTNIPIIYYFFASIINAYEKNQQTEKALNETKMQLSHYRNAAYIQEQIKKERHELKNNYFYIQTLLSEKKYDTLDHYLSETIGEKLDQLSEIQTGNTLMDYLINRKVKEARKLNIRVYSEILVPESLHVNEDALCTILLNLLDNAITASKTEKEPDIHIAIRCVNEYLALKIKNHCSMNVIENNPAFETTKEDSENHGFGIKIMKETADKYNGMINFTYEDGYFIATAMLPMQMQ